MTQEVQTRILDIYMKALEIMLEEIRIQKMEPEQKRKSIATVISLLHDILDLLEEIEDYNQVPPLV